MSKLAAIDDKKRIRGSMLWAAYGDALGFITELCDRSTLSHRTRGTTRITELISWRRKIGGMNGVSWQFEAGTYSDDTQLRLAVCRTIRGDGDFDVEPFAKVEIPIFLSYALGAGIGTKAAADSLKKASVSWNTNFFETKRSRYVDGGGNGAAMRIQPHVWSALPDTSEEELVGRVLRDSVVTHGHPVGLLGAVFHALHLHRKLKGESIEPADWGEIVDRLEIVPEIASKDDDLALLWIPEWERRSGRAFRDAIVEVISELRLDLEQVLRVLSSAPASEDPEQVYARVATEIGAFDRRCRGSGTKTALLAATVSHLFADNCHGGMVTCANLLGTDTDTIATMAGAVLGLSATAEPPQDVADKAYLIYQADRMSGIRAGGTVDTHHYPNLLNWSPPKNNLDSIASSDHKTYLKGYGEISSTGQRHEQGGRYPAVWESFKTPEGQSLVVKRRKKMPEITESDLPSRSNVAEARSSPTQPELNLDSMLDELTVDHASDLVIKSGFDPAITGRALVALAEQDNGIEKAIGFAAIVAKARQVRLRKRK